MIEEFRILDKEGAELIKNIGSCPSKFCDFTPFVLLTWQRLYGTEYMISEGDIFLKLIIDGKTYYAIQSCNIVSAVKRLFKVTGESEIHLSLVEESALPEIEKAFSVSTPFTDDSWWDYIYLHSDLSSFQGKRFSGQRNHVNKFKAENPDWRYEEIVRDNLSEVSDFWRALIKDTPALSDTQSFEREMVTSYLEGGYFDFPTKGALIRGRDGIVAFAFGEIIDDVLYVHVEKARRDVQGAYQMIVKEFASHNEATLVNREEDMGIEGLKTSKESYHPIEKIKKYSVIISQ